MASEKCLRWGIASAGLISHDFAAALQLETTENHKVVAVAARDKTRAEKFANDLNIPKSYGAYEDMAKDPDIDVVYVGSIPAAHVGIAKVMMAANKPVLIEKPASVNYRTTKELVDFARERKVLCMEGMFSRFFPAFRKLRDVLESGEVGEAKIINFVMGFNYKALHREMAWRMDPKAGGGMSHAFGVYAVSLAQWVFREKPVKVVATADMSDTGCDLTSTFVLHYSGQRSMVVTVSSQCHLDNLATVCCTDGIIKIPEPWAPIGIKVKDQWYDYPLPTNDVKFNYFNCEGFVYEADHIRELLLKGELESPVMSHQTSLDIIETIDDVRHQLGVRVSDD